MPPEDVIYGVPTVEIEPLRCFKTAPFTFSDQITAKNLTTKIREST